MDAVVFLDEKSVSHTGQVGFVPEHLVSSGQGKNCGTRLLTLYSSNASFHESIRAESSQISSCLISPVSVPIVGYVLERCCEEIVVYEFTERAKIGACMYSTTYLPYLSLPVNPLRTRRSATIFWPGASPYSVCCDFLRLG